MNPRSLLQTTTLALALAASVSLKADPLMLLEPGQPTTPDPTDYPGILAALPVATISSPAAAFSPGTVSGTLATYVYSDIAENPFSGGLTFVYELKNTSLTGTEGIGFLEIGGWAGIDVWVGYGTSLLSTASAASPVQPGETRRSEDGGTITFTFPPGSSEPPIFAGEDGMQLILFTNATSWTSTSANVVTNDFLDIRHIAPDTTQILTVSALTAGAASVADGGTTVMMLGAALLALVMVTVRRARRSAV